MKGPKCIFCYADAHFVVRSNDEGERRVRLVCCYRCSALLEFFIPDIIELTKAQAGVMSNKARRRAVKEAKKVLKEWQLK